LQQLDSKRNLKVGLPAQDHAEMEAMVKKHQDEQWARYDAQQVALVAARQRLLAEVHEARQHQIADKALVRQAAAAEQMDERRRMLQEAQEMQKVEQEYRAAAQHAALRQRLDLQGKVRAVALASMVMVGYSPSFWNMYPLQ
jgi:hypothetical protein